MLNTTLHMHARLLLFEWLRHCVSAARTWNLHGFLLKTLLTVTLIFLGSGTMDVFQHRYWQISACCSIHLYKVLRTLTVPRPKIIHCLFLFTFLPNWGSPQTSTSRPWERPTATTTSFASGPFSHVSSSTRMVGRSWLLPGPGVVDIVGVIEGTKLAFV